MNKNHVDDDISKVIYEVPEHDLLVGGFPCQDYSVARTNARGIQIKDKNGKVLINKKAKTIKEETNFPKSKNNVIFLRGTGKDATAKTLPLNGYRYISNNVG